MKDESESKTKTVDTNFDFRWPANKQETKEEEEDETIKDVGLFNESDSVLVVGDGNLTFSLCLAKHFAKSTTFKLIVSTYLSRE